MLSISYLQMVILISTVWLIIRSLCWVQQKQISIKREAALLLVYICIIVVVRFTFCPFGKVDGHIQPLLFDHARILPFWTNFRPFVYWFDYPTMKEAWLNLIGNTTMFIPLGIVWPSVFKKLNSHKKVLIAGLGIPLTIEILQLPFYGRCSDIDDIILNFLGFLIGYGIYLLVRKLRKAR